MLQRAQNRAAPNLRREANVIKPASGVGKRLEATRRGDGGLRQPEVGDTAEEASAVRAEAPAGAAGRGRRAAVEGRRLQKKRFKPRSSSKEGLPKSEEGCSKVFPQPGFKGSWAGAD